MMSTDTKDENEQITIENVSKFLDEIKKLPVKKGYELIYRGVDKLENALPENDRPSIFRKPKHIKNEDKMFHELVARKPDDFEKCRNTFEHLVIMQHYKLPTRLLDVTYNPLVALYFACTGKSNTKDGRVIIYQNKVDKICNYNSDRVTCLANLSKSNFEMSIFQFFVNSNVYFYKIFLGYIEQYSYDYRLLTNKLIGAELKEFKYDYYKTQFKYYKEIIFNNKSNDVFKHALKNKLSPDKNNLLKISIEKLLKYERDFEEKYSKFQSDGNLEYENYFLNLLPYFLNQIITSFREDDNIFINYRRNIINEKPAFKPELIKTKDISNVYFVQPKQSNSRITAQNGAFLIFGLHKEANDKSKNPLIPNATSKEKAPVQRLSTQLIIPKKNKKAILKELATLNITKASLFPEIENVADVIKEKYKQ